ANAQGLPASNTNPLKPELDVRSAIDRATGLALQGDAAAAVKVLAEIPEANFKGEDADFRACMLDRFGSNHPAPIDQNLSDPWLASLATDYLTYWNHSLTKPHEREQAESELGRQVGKLLGRSLTNDADYDAAEDELKAKALKRGFHLLLGRTQPLRELM